MDHLPDALMMPISDASIAITALTSDMPHRRGGQRILFACGRIRGGVSQLWVAPADARATATAPESVAA